MKVRKVIFYEGKTLYWVVRVVFHGDRDFFLFLNCHGCNEGQFRDKKVEISMKNPVNYPIKCFAQIRHNRRCIGRFMSQRPTYWYKKHEMVKISMKNIQNGILCAVLCNLHHILTLSKGFHGDKGFFYLLIVLSVTRNNLKVNKVIISLKTPSKWSIMNSTYCGGHMWKSMKKIQEIRKFLSHTDWVYKPARLFELITMFQGLLCFTGSTGNQSY